MASNDYTANGVTPGLMPFPEKGSPKGSRLKDAASLVSLYLDFRNDDRLSASQRAGIRAQINGAPPYREQVNSDKSNLNFGEAQARLNQTLTAYNDMLDSVKSAISAEIPINLYDDTSRQNAEDVIAEEFTTMLRNWSEFDSRWQFLAKEFVEHGVAFGNHPDDFDWKFDTAGWDTTLIPRGTRASEDFVECLLQTKDEVPSKLYKAISNEDAAREAGWNVNMVKKALVRATRFSGGNIPANWMNEWDALNRQLKSNDIFVSNHKNPKVHLVHGLIREYDGSFSHFISDSDQTDPSGTEQEFLYKKVSRFKSATNCFTIFCLNIGDGYYHSIRGLGYAMYGWVQTQNKMLNDLVNNYRLSLAMLIQKKDINGLDTSPIIINGGMAVLSPEVEFIERQFQNHATSSLAVLRDFSMRMDSVTPVSQRGEASAGDPVMTKYQLQGRQSAGSALSIGAQNMFYRSWCRLLRECWRRVQEIIKSDRTEFSEVFEFVERCERRGIPKDMILAVERVGEVRAIGGGSPGMQQQLLDKGLSMMGTLDEKGRDMYKHDWWAANFGTRRAMRYSPLQEKSRPVQDQFDATVENSLMFGGGNMDPVDGQNHSVHALMHIGGPEQVPSIAASIQVLENWRNNGEQGDITELQPHIAFLSMIVPHTERHVEAMSLDPTRAEQAAGARKALQQYAAIYMTYVRQLQKALDEQEQEAGQQAQPDPAEMAKLQKMQVQLEMTMRAFQQKEQLKVIEVQNRMEQERRKTDQQLAIMAAKYNAELASQLPSASASDILTNRSLRTPVP